VSLRKRASRSAFQASFQIFREALFRQRDIRHQVPRLEFIGVNRFSGIVVINPNSQSFCATDVGLLGLDQAL
jgi:hypothetical protein